MEYCSACKSILKPEYTFCPFCGAKRPGQADAAGADPADSNEVLLLAKPDKDDVVIYRSWEVIEAKLKRTAAPKEPLPPASEPGKTIITGDTLPPEPDEPASSGKQPIEPPASDPAKAPKNYEGEIPLEEIAQALPGAVVRIGDIPWHVLWMRADSCLLVADQPVVKMALTESSHQVSWRTSRLRKWLNNTFISEFFTPAQREHLQTVKNSTSIRRKDGYDFIESTEERVSILSRQEYEFYVSRCSHHSWELYAEPGLVRDLSSDTSGSGSVLTLSVQNGKENWVEARTYVRTQIYPMIWWRMSN